MQEKFYIVHKDEIKKFAASFPESSLGEHPPSHVILYADGQKAYLRTQIRRGASGNQIWISKNILPSLSNGTTVTFKSASLSRYRLFRLYKDPDQRLALLGFLMAGTGVIIDAFLAIGKIKAFISVSEETIISSMGVSSFLKFVGLGLIFLKKFWEGNG